MALYLEKAIFVNRAPFEHLELDFKEKGINVLSAVNGKGKTTILSHITDAFYEMARECFGNSFEGRENTYYRFSSSLFHLVMGSYSIVYLRFKYNNEVVDYIDCRGKDLTKKQYEGEIKLQNIIPYNDISSALGRNNCAKIFSRNLDNKKIENIFGDNVLTFFPAYRYETPFYLTDPYKISFSFNADLNFNGYLKNPIEVRTEVQMLAGWIMDIVLDSEVYKQRREININGQQQTIDVTPERTMFENLCKVLSEALSSKYKEDNLRLGIGKRSDSGQRVSIVQSLPNKRLRSIAPNIFCLSSGELSLLCLFGEIMRQADNLHTNIRLGDVMGIVLVDEVDLHLHIKLQKEVLPRLFKLFCACLNLVDSF